MLDLERGRRAVLNEVDGLIEQLATASREDWALPVRCSGWRVIDLALHASIAPLGAAEGFRRMAAGITEQPPPPQIPRAEPSSIVAALRQGRIELDASLSPLTEGMLQATFPINFISLPGVAGLQLLVTELGVHHNDLVWAFGDRQSLPPEVIKAASFSVTHMLLRAARASSMQPPGAMSYRLSGSSVCLSFTFEHGAWQPGEGASGTVCEIAGDDSAVLLFALGRIDITDPGVKVLSEESLASSFKAYFPGP